MERSSQITEGGCFSDLLLRLCPALPRPEQTYVSLSSFPTDLPQARPSSLSCQQCCRQQRGCMSEGNCSPQLRRRGHVLASRVRSKWSSQETAEAVLRGRNRRTKSAYCHRTVINIYYAVSSFHTGSHHFRLKNLKFRWRRQ